MTRLPRHYAAARGSYASEVAAAAGDFANSFRQTRLWSVLAWNDILSRYRGSILGPFWLTISTCVFVAGISLIYGGLSHASTEIYIPFIATGVVLWNLINTMISDGSEAFVAGAQIIRQTSIPLPLFIWRVVFRNLLAFAHQVPVIFAVALWFGYLLKIDLPMALLGFALVVINLAWGTFLAAIFAARFRDVQQVIASLLQLLFFISPIIWLPTANPTGFRHAVLKYDPISFMLDVTRNPLLGQAVPLRSLIALAALAVCGWIFTFGLYAMVRRRIVHYL